MKIIFVLGDSDEWKLFAAERPPVHGGSVKHCVRRRLQGHHQARPAE